MKKLMILITITILMVSCNERAEKKKKRNSNMIQLIESKVIEGTRISIISIDGKFYATSNRGVIVSIDGGVIEKQDAR